MTGYVRQSAADIVPTAVVRAAPINNELNALRDAFLQATGHRHDGVASEGGYVPIIADSDANNKIAVDTVNNRHNVFVEVGGVSVEQLRIQDGLIVPVTNNDIDLGTGPLKFKDLNLAGDLSASGGSATFNNVTINGTFDVTNTVISNVATPTLDTDGANKAYVDSVINALIDSSPGTLDTLNEIAAALGDDPNFAATMTTELAKKLDKTGGSMTGAIAMGGNKITGLGAPTTGSDAVTKTYVDTTFSSVDDAATSAAAAAASAAAAATSYDNFDDRYLGAKSSAPSLDNDGNTLLVGAMYFDTTANEMRVWTAGLAWKATGSAVNGTTERYVYTATAAQTTFAVNYDVGFVDVYLNGTKQVVNVDFTATSGTDVVLATGATAGDIVDIVAYGAFTVANTYTVAQSDVLLAAKASLTGVETLTNKTIALGSNTVTGTLAQFNTAVTDADFASLSGSETLTNKTLGTGTLLGATINGQDNNLTRVDLQDYGYVYFNSGTTNTLNFENGSHQRWAPNTGAQTLSITNWPPSGNLGELLIEGVNLGAATITWPTINWITSTGATTTTFSSNGVTLQTSGTDWVFLWTRDAGTTIYGKVVR